MTKNAKGALLSYNFDTFLDHAFFQKEWEGLVVNSSYDRKKGELILIGVDSENKVVYKKVIPCSEEPKDWKICDILIGICFPEISRAVGKDKNLERHVKRPTLEKPSYHMNVSFCPIGYLVLPEKEKTGQIELSL